MAGILKNQEDRPPFPFPSTRFQGSKLKIANWIWEIVKEFDFQSVLEPFGGTGCMGHLFKTKGKKVIYNDILKFNWYIGLALVENDYGRLGEDDILYILTPQKKVEYPTFISDVFKDIYYTNEENQWLDMVATNISLMEEGYKKALAYFALFQSCIIKRPFNLFHRKNLYLRLSSVKRSFGNKVAWDRPFGDHFRKFALEGNRAVFGNNRRNRALNLDVFQIENSADMVYLDPPYISGKGVGVDYLSFYHFLEGMVNYDKWPEMIDYKSKHRRLTVTKSVWTNRHLIAGAFERLFEMHSSSIIVLSYRSDGIPSIKRLKEMLSQHKSRVYEWRQKEQPYVLSRKRSNEVLLIGI